MLAIKNNLMAENAARHLGRSYDALAKSVERLSSGLRINSSKDDAAGLAVRELVRADVTQIKQASRNAQDAISMLQTAEGAMGVIDNLLIRMKELAEQSSTESYSDDQRTIMNQEFAQLSDEITRIAQSTKFNGIALLDSTDTFTIHVGGDAAAGIDIVAESVTSTGLGLGTTGTKSQVALEVGTANPNLTGFLTGEAGGGDLTVDFGNEATMTVNFAAGVTYSMNEVATLINAASQTSGSYNAASISYNSDTGLYSLTIKAEDVGVKAITLGGDQSGLQAADFSQTVGTAGGAVTIGTQSGATSALADLTSAITTKDEYRAKLGYLMNRLQSAVQILDIQAENLVAAESRISDVDVATEMAAMTRNQVLAQAGISMLSQANTTPQMAIQLLRG